MPDLLIHPFRASDLKTILFLLILFVLVISLFSTALAQTSDPAAPEPLILTEGQVRYPLGFHLELLEDPSGALTIEDVVSPEFDSQFVLSQAAVPNYGFTDSA